MVDKSIIFDFTRVPRFMDDYNLETAFQVAQMDGINKNYEFVIADSCPANIEDCLNSNGTLKTTGEDAVHPIDIGNDGQVSLIYSSGVNASRIISLGSSDVTIDVGDINVMLKAMFLRDIHTGYVLAYCILARSIPITNQVIFPASGVVWTIRNEG